MRRLAAAIRSFVADMKGGRHLPILHGYVRVSTLDQNEVRQLEGMKLDKTFTDKASGKDVKRPRLEAMQSFVREGDIVFCHSMDRLGRNLEDLRRIVLGLTGRGISIVFVNEI